MALKFLCSHCGAEIITNFLKPGELADCKRCHQKTQVPANADNVEGYSTTERQTASDASRMADHHPSVKYSALRTVSAVFKFIAVLTGILALVAVVIGLSMTGEPYSHDLGLIVVVVSIFIGVVSTVILVALAESIEVIIDIESNTREQVKHLKKIAGSKAD